jgi:hypothetical protein
MGDYMTGRYWRVKGIVEIGKWRGVLKSGEWRVASGEWEENKRDLSRSFEMTGGGEVEGKKEDAMNRPYTGKERGEEEAKTGHKLRGRA